MINKFSTFISIDVLPAVYFCTDSQTVAKVMIVEFAFYTTQNAPWQPCVCVYRWFISIVIAFNVKSSNSFDVKHTVSHFLFVFLYWEFKLEKIYTIFNCVTCDCIFSCIWFINCMLDFVWKTNFQSNYSKQFITSVF